MSKFIIRGGKKLSGTYTPAGNKNAVLPMLAACVLTDQTVTLDNVPLIEDVRCMLELLEQLGVAVKLRGHTATLCAAHLRRTKLDPVLCGKVRTSILFAGPLLARHGRVTLPSPGGDIIGRRPLDTHFRGLEALGAKVQAGANFQFTAKSLKGADIVLPEASVTATENVLMAAVRASGKTTIFNAACEPHVQDLCQMLIGMGACITGVGTNLLTIDGVLELHGVSHTIAPDHVDVASILAASAITGGEIKIAPVPHRSCAILAHTFERLGVKWTLTNDTLHFDARKGLRIKNDVGSAIPKIEDGPWPGFPSDLMSIAIVLACQAKGTVLMHEKMFESRMYFVDRLIQMGARIVQCDPHRVIITGPARLRGMPISSPDIRAGLALVLAALCARGTSTIDQAQVIDRGYEKLEDTLRGLGADIERSA